MDSISSQPRLPRFPNLNNWPGAANFLEREHGLPDELASQEVAPFLAIWGFPAADATSWRSEGSAQLRVRVPTHGELGGQEHYAMVCELLDAEGQIVFNWVGMRTLTHLRTGLHDPVKASLGGDYARVFAEAPFARHFGPPGTTARLDSWSEAFAECVNARALPPAVVAQALRVLDIPALSGLRGAAVCATRMSPLDAPTLPDGLEDIAAPPAEPSVRPSLLAGDDGLAGEDGAPSAAAVAEFSKYLEEWANTAAAGTAALAALGASDLSAEGAGAAA